MRRSPLLLHLASDASKVLAAHGLHHCRVRDGLNPVRREPGVTTSFEGRDETVPIAEVSRLLSVPLPTLRSWELRYHIPHAREPGGKHRRYGPADLRALRLMRDFIARGLVARDAADAVKRLLSETGTATPFIASFLDGAARSDSPAMREALSAAGDLLGIGTCLDDVLMPAMQQVGVWWQLDRCDIEQEHLATETARSWIYSHIQTAPPPWLGPVLLVCGPTDMHTIGLEALALLLRDRGIACRLLTDRPSTLAVTTAITVNRPKALVVVSHLSVGRRRATETISAAHALGCAVFYAGNAFTSVRSRGSIPGTYLGTHLRDARDVLMTALGSGRAAPAGEPAA